jgi:parvulin-like peptidyl-prolyl isomerase
MLGCADLTMPIGGETQAQAVNAEPRPVQQKPAERAAKPSPPDTGRQRVEKEERIAASHVLVAFKGSRRAKGGITRSKEEAKKRAEEVRDKARKGEDFAALAKQYSDGPSAGKGGSLGKFGKTSMVKPFADAAFALKVGDVSNVVETEFGFHVIQRTE